MIPLINHDSSEVAVRSLEFAYIYTYTYNYIIHILSYIINNSICITNHSLTSFSTILQCPSFVADDASLWNAVGRAGKSWTGRETPSDFHIELSMSYPSESLTPQKIKHNSIMMDFDLFLAELQELREPSGSKKGVLPGPGYNSRWARKGTIAFSLSFFGMLLKFSDQFLDQHEKHWNFRCRFKHKHVVVNVFFRPGVSSSNL